MKRIAFIFPGQGSQTVGMGKEMYEAYDVVREIIDEADQYLDRSLKELMFEGPGEELTQTEYAQPALLLISAAIQTLLKEHGIKPVMAAGHSLGEYSALVASEALRLADAIPLVNKRGKLMEQAFPKGQGTMAAVLGMKEDQVREILLTIHEKTGEIAEIANLNCPGQIVISGTKEGISKAGEQLKSEGAKRVLPLNVSGPFHSSLMKPASKDFSEVLEHTLITNSNIPVYANVTASPVQDKEEIQKLLVEQIYSPVRFQETIVAMKEENIDAVVEVGNGKVLTGLVKKIDRELPVFAVHDPGSAEKFIQWFKEE